VNTLGFGVLFIMYYSLHSSSLNLKLVIPHSNSSQLHFRKLIP